MSTAIALALTAIAAPSAGAATEFGSDCAANASEPNVTVVQLQKATGSALPLTAPGAGVLTAWTVRVDPSAFVEESDRLKLMIFRSQTNPSKLETIGESAEETVAHGTDSFKTRIPVQAGDRLGLYGANSPGTLACTTGSVEDEIGLLRAAAPLGSINTFPPASKDQVPVSATLEPDKDGDGYGDETQDKCPQSAAYQTACPVVKLSSRASTGRKAVIAYVSASLSAPVKVSATVYLGGGKKTVLTAPRRTVTPGHLTAFELTLTGKVAKSLKSLPTKQALLVKITADASNLTGRPSTSVSRAKLAGRAAAGA